MPTRIVAAGSRCCRRGNNFLRVDFSYVFLIKSRSVFARVGSIPTTLELLRVLRLSHDRKQGIGTVLATLKESETRIVDQALSRVGDLRHNGAKYIATNAYTSHFGCDYATARNFQRDTRRNFYSKPSRHEREKTWRKISENGTQKHRRCDIFVVKKLNCYRKTILEI